MIGARVVGVGMQQDGQPQAVELQPRYDDRQQVVGEAEIERGRYMWATRLQIPIAQLHRETIRRPLTHQRGLLVGVFVKIEMRVDRKSTRLNSSHLGISYAVFCLKKNTQ